MWSLGLLIVHLQEVMVLPFENQATATARATILEYEAIIRSNIYIILDPIRRNQMEKDIFEATGEI